MSQTSRRIGWRIGRAVVGGAVIAVGLGLGAHNAVWVVVVATLPLVLVGSAISPAATRTSELPTWPAAAGTAVRARIRAVTRSSLGSDDVQPTAVTATIEPRDDTPYDARWVTAVGRAQAGALLANPDQRLPADRLPPRTAAAPPSFDRLPPRWTAVYPALTVAVCAAVLFGVSGETWHIDTSASSLARKANLPRPPGTADRTYGPDQIGGSLRALVAQIDRIGPEANRNVLTARISRDGDITADVFDPATGEAVALRYNRGSDEWAAPDRRPTPMRAADTFPTADLTRTDGSDLVRRMQSSVRATGAKTDFVEFTAKRTRGAPTALVAGFGDWPIASSTVEGRPDGTIAEFFDPMDLDTSFRLLRAAMAAARVSATAPIIEELEIRGTKDNTPIIQAGTIQNSGGIRVGFVRPSPVREIAIVPGAFPTADGTPSRGEGFPLTAASPKLFASVREQAFRRGNIPPYDQGAVDIQMGSVFDYASEYGRTIRIQVAREPAASGTYDIRGRFLSAGT